MGINRNAIGKADLTGLPWPPGRWTTTSSSTRRPATSRTPATVGHVQPRQGQADARRRRLEAERAVPHEGRQDARLRFVIPTGVPASKQEGELTQAMLKDIGVKLDINSVPSDDFFDKYVIPGNYDITPFAWLGTPFPISSAQSIYANPTKDAKGELQIQQNFARVGSPEIDDLMDKAAQDARPEPGVQPDQPGGREGVGPRPLGRVLPAAADDRGEQEPRERRLVRLRAAGLHEDRLHEQPELIGPAEAT
jgi:peptide/nickel transport system substrate-binding protein